MRGDRGSYPPMIGGPGGILCGARTPFSRWGDPEPSLEHLSELTRAVSRKHLQGVQEGGGVRRGADSGLGGPGHGESVPRPRVLEGGNQLSAPDLPHTPSERTCKR